MSVEQGNCHCLCHAFPECSAKAHLTAPWSLLEICTFFIISILHLCFVLRKIKALQSFQAAGGEFSLIMIRGSNQQKCIVVGGAENLTKFSLGRVHLVQTMCNWGAAKLDKLFTWMSQCKRNCKVRQAINSVTFVSQTTFSFISRNAWHETCNQ